MQPEDNKNTTTSIVDELAGSLKKYAANVDSDLSHKEIKEKAFAEAMKEKYLNEALLEGEMSGESDKTLEDIWNEVVRERS